MNFLQSIDLLGEDFKFKINGGQYKTPFGGFLSTLLILSALVSCWYFGQDLYLMKSPSFFEVRRPMKSYPTKTLNSSNFFFALVLYDKDGNSFDDKAVYTYNFIYYNFTRNTSTGVMEMLKQNIN